MSYRGRRVAFAGRFAAVTREEAAELVAQAGGTPVSRCDESTDIVVVGAEPWPIQDDGHLAVNLERARALIEGGRSLEIVSEHDFLAALGATGVDERPLDTLYTTAQLARLLRIPARRIRAWIRRGILKPARTEARLDYFDFRQAAEVKRLAELTARGASVATIRESLAQLARWLPENESALQRLDTLGGSAGLLVRLGPGRLAEPSGQMTLGFGAEGATGNSGPAAPAGSDDDSDLDSPEETRPAGRPRLFVIEGGAGASTPTPLSPPAAAPVLPTNPRTADEWFELALELEDADHLDEAARAYREALLAGGPSAEIAFNLGNVLHSLGRLEEALSRFEQAVEIDPAYAEAWNNLASVHAQFEEWEEAIAAGRRAVELAPAFPDAHYNLAEAYLGAGRAQDARRHARVYLEADPKSPWASRLRQNLGLAS